MTTKFKLNKTINKFLQAIRTKKEANFVFRVLFPKVQYRCTKIRNKAGIRQIFCRNRMGDEVEFDLSIA